jgi:hypothetical protein
LEKILIYAQPSEVNHLLDETGQNSTAAIDNHSSSGLVSAVIQSAG